MFFTSTADAASRFGFDENKHHDCTPEQMRLQDELGDIPNEVLQQIYDMHIKEAEHEIEQLQEQKREKVTQLKSNNSKMTKIFLEKNPLDRMPFFILNDNFALIHTFSEAWWRRQANFVLETSKSGIKTTNGTNGFPFSSGPFRSNISWPKKSTSFMMNSKLRLETSPNANLNTVIFS